MAEGLDNKITNVIGSRIPMWAINQLTRRSMQNSKFIRDNDNIKYLANKTGWVRLVSSVNMKANTEASKKFGEGDSLAKKFVLFGGVSSYSEKSNSVSGTEFNYILREGFQETYNLLGEYEKNKYGYRPMPGISSAKIETQGRLGSVRAATIQFKVWDKEQLDIMEALYFKLGYMMFLEWGNTFYYNEKDELVESEYESINPFGDYVDKDITRIKISNNIRKSSGNYDAMLGLTTNFNFALNQAGGYDCSIKIISLGVLSESIRINGKTQLPQILEGELKALAEYKNSTDEAEAQKKLDEQKASDPESYPECVRQFPIRTSASGKEKYASGQGDYIDYIFYSNYRYVQRSTNKRGNYACFNGDILIDGKMLASGKNLTYDQFIEKVKDKTPIIPSIQIQGKHPYDYYVDTGDKEYIGLSQFKKVIDIKYFNKKNDVKVWLDFNKIYKASTQNILVDVGFGNKVASIKVNFLGNNKSLKYLAEGVSESGRYIGKPVYSLPSYIVNSKENDGLTEPIAGVFKIDESNGQSFPKDMMSELYSKKIPFGSGDFGIVGDFYQTRFRYFPNREVSAWKVATNSYVDISSKLGKFNIDICIGDTGYGYYPNEDFAKDADGDNKGIYRDIVKYEDYKNKVDEKVLSHLLDPSSEYRITNIDEKTIASGLLKYVEYEASIGLIIDLDLDANIFDKADVTDTSKKIKRVATRYHVFLLKVRFTDSSIISKIEIPEDKEVYQVVDEDAVQEAIKAQNVKQTEEQNEDLIPDLDVKDILSQTSINFQSDLECILYAIRVHSLSRLLMEQGNDGFEKYDQVAKYKYFGSEAIQKDINFMESLLSNGIIKYDILKKLNNNDLSQDELFIKYGYNHNLLGGKTNETEIKELEVKYEDLLTSYVVPYQSADDLFQNANLTYPVYIPLGFLVMLMNHTATLYDNTKGKPVPLVYIDYNPETNFCLTNEVTLTTNPFKFLIRYEGTNEKYKELLFDQEVIEGDNIKAPKEDKVAEPLFNFKDKDAISYYLPKFQVEKSYSGKIMNILVNISYLLNIIRTHSTKDETNGVYIKSFLEEILSDLNKTLGNINMFRLAYSDYGDCFYISDDQVQRGLSGKEDKNTTSVQNMIHVFGVDSIAENLEIKTEISPKLGSLLGISANADDGSQASSGEEASSFHLPGYLDRFKHNLTSNATSKVDKKLDTEIIAAQQFNESIRQFYSTGENSEDRTSAATNYYIHRMTKIKSEDPATRSSAIIPVSLNFTTDGISGLNMGQGFTVSDEVLPYSYTIPKYDIIQDKLSKLGFIVSGLDHTIENNRWKTNVRAMMYYMKDLEQYTGSLNQEALRQNNFNITIGDTTYVDSVPIDGIAVKGRALQEPGFSAKLQEIANYLKTPAKALEIVMMAESSLDPKAVNKFSKATGLIQFMPDTARGLGTSVTALYNMTAVQQLDYVKKYFSGYVGRVGDVYRLYAVTFFPLMLQYFNDNSWVIKSDDISANKLSKQNPAIANAAGKTPGTPLTIGDFKTYVSKHIESKTRV